MAKYNLTSSGSTAAEPRYDNSRRMFAASGDFGGGTVTLEMSIDGGTTYFAVRTDTTITSDGGAYYQVDGCLMRATLSGATSPDVDVQF